MYKALCRSSARPRERIFPRRRGSTEEGLNCNSVFGLGSASDCLGLEEAASSSWRVFRLLQMLSAPTSCTQGSKGRDRNTEVACDLLKSWYRRCARLCRGHFLRYSISRGSVSSGSAGTFASLCQGSKHAVRFEGRRQAVLTRVVPKALGAARAASLPRGIRHTFRNTLFLHFNWLNTGRNKVDPGGTCAGG